MLHKLKQADKMESGFSGQFGFDSDARAELLSIIKELSFEQRNVTLSSGRPSTIYFDMKVTMFNHRGSSLMGRAIGELAEQCGAEFVGGLEMGAVPISASATTVADYAESNVQFFFVRKIAKDHGAKKVIEGLPKSVSLLGKRVVVVDDVTTTGGSAIQAVNIIRGEGGIVEDLITIVDRQEGAREAFKDIGVKLHPVFEASEFLKS